MALPAPPPEGSRRPILLEANVARILGMVQTSGKRAGRLRAYRDHESRDRR